MTSLSLDNNHIGNIDPIAFQGIPKLRKLHLQNNVLRTIKRQMFASLTSLTELDLRNNRISNIEAQSFSGLANLRELNLLGNRLPKLDDIMMRYPSTLNAMYLDQNKLVSFHRETFSGQVNIGNLKRYFDIKYQIKKIIFSTELLKSCHFFSDDC